MSNEFQVFIRNVLDNENLNDWQFQWEDSNEGYCCMEHKIIFIGEESRKKLIYFKFLILHEISHILIDNNHYSKKFNEKMIELCKKYCTRREKIKMRKYVKFYSYFVQEKGEKKEKQVRIKNHE